MITQARFLIDYMVDSDYPVEKTNLIGIEGVDENLAPNGDQHNQWNDRILLVKSDGGLLFNGTASTEPGRHYVQNPMNARGAAYLAFGYHKDIWGFGHHGTQRRYPALVQINPCVVVRDANKSAGRSENEKLDMGNFGINLHHGYGAATVDRNSAGCQVLRFPTALEKLLGLLRQYKTPPISYTLISGEELLKWRQSR